MAQAGGHGALTSVLISHQLTVLTAAELKTPAKIAQWATDALYAYNSNLEFARTQLVAWDLVLGARSLCTAWRPPIRHLKYIVFDRRIAGAWDTVLGMAVRIINTTKHASIGVSPAQLFSVGRDLDRQLLPSAVPAETKQYIDTLIPNDKRRREAVHQYISHLTSMQAEVVRAANEWQDKVVQRRVVDRQPETVRAFKQGDWVVHRHFGNRRPTKLSPLWIGPYQVLDQASNSMYRLQDPADLKEHLCHIDELYEYRMGLTDDVVDVIALDQFEAIVHSIVDHRAVGKSKSQWVFRVRFVDCDPSEDVWLPFAEANQLSAMDEYLDLPHNRKLGLA